MPDYAAAEGAAAPPAPIAVLVVDDQLAVREGVARLISCAGLPLREVATAATASQALAAALRMQPDIVVLDVDLGGDDGLLLIPRLSRDARVLVLTSHGDSATRARARSLGVRAFVEKHQPAVELLASLAALAHPHLRGEQAPTSAGHDSRVPTGTSSAALYTPHP